MMDGMMGMHGWMWIVVLLLLAILGGIVVLIARSGRGGKAGAALVALAIPAFVTACGERGTPDAAGSPSPAARETPGTVATAPGLSSAQAHPIRGRIEAIAADRRTVTLDHEAVPGVMDAMTMEYKVPDPSILQGLAVGDRVQGHFEARPGGEYVITHLAK